MNSYKHIVNRVKNEVSAKFPHAHITYETCKRGDGSVYRYDKKVRGKIHYEITAPSAKTLIDLTEFLHEVGHLMCGHLQPKALRDSRVTRCKIFGGLTIPKARQEQEVEASEWALTYMRQLGLSTRTGHQHLQRALVGYRVYAKLAA